MLALLFFLALACSVSGGTGRAVGWRQPLDFVPVGGLQLGRYILGSSAPWSLNKDGLPYYFFVLESKVDGHVSAEQLHDHFHGKSGGYHPELKELLETLLEEEPEGRDMNVLDVGANVGSFSLHAASLNVRVFAFEMQPELYTLVELSKRVNGFTKLHVHNAALWHETGVEISFTPMEGNLGGTALQTDAKSGALKMKTTRLVDHFFHGPVFFLKLDCEGAEQHVLAGFAEPLANGTVKHLFMETRSNQAHIINYFYDIGFMCSPRDCDRNLVDKQTFAEHIRSPLFSANVYCKFVGPAVANPPVLEMLANDIKIV